MNSSEQIDKVSEAIVSVSKAVRVVGKSGDNKFDKYMYAKLEDYILGTSGPLADAGLSILTSVDAAESLPVRTTKNGGSEYPVRVFLTIRAVHTSGQWIEAKAIGEGQDRGDKGLYKAITGGKKYGYANMLGLGTSDDPENDNAPEPPPSQRAAPKQDPKPAAESPAAAFARIVSEWSGVAAEDRRAACTDAAKRCGVVWKKDISDADSLKALAIVTEARGRGQDYAEFLAETK